MTAQVIAVGSSVVVAVFRDEPEAPTLLARLAPYERRIISAANWFEAYMVCQGKNEDPGLADLFDEVVSAMGLEVVPLTREHAAAARTAFLRYGKGREHPAHLNFGDRFAYGLARSLDAPLLFKGLDFTHTDVKAA